MPLPVPNLDDRTFEQLVDEARALIPRNFPEWTDHNPSDPGVTLMELFAFLIETAIYEINRVPERSLENFARLVSEVEVRQPNEAIVQTLRRALDAIEAKKRAITEAEFERLAKAADDAEPNPNQIARANAFVSVVNTPNVFPPEQIVKVMIVPNEPNNPAPVPAPALRQKVFAHLRSLCLIGTRVQVVPPSYRGVDIDATIARDRESRLARETVQRNVEQAIRSFLSPLRGGVSGAGWEFGRSLFRSELYQILEGIAGVDHVQRLFLNHDDLISELPLPSAEALVRLDNLSVTVVEQ